MEIILITPPAPEEVIPDRENDRLFMDMVERGDNGEFTGTQLVEFSLDETVALVEVYVEELRRITIAI